MKKAGAIEPTCPLPLNEHPRIRLAHARRIIDAFEQADTGLVVIDGKLIEKPVLRDMHRILAIAARISA